MAHPCWHHRLVAMCGLQPCESWHPSTALVKLRCQQQQKALAYASEYLDKILAIGVPKIYWHVSSRVAQPLTNWLELTWRGLSLWAVGKGSPFPPHTWTSARMLQDICLPHLQLKVHPAIVWPNSLGQLVCWNVKTTFGIRLMVLQLTCHSLAKSWHQPWWNSSLEAAVCSSATAPSSARNRKSGQSTSSSLLPFRGKPFLSVSHTHYFRYGNNTFWRN